MALPDPYTIPEMELTPEGDRWVRFRMTDAPGINVMLTRRAARHLLQQLALRTPEWLIDE